MYYRVKAWREQAALTVRDLAKKADISTGTIWRMEQGETVAADIVVRVANALNITIVQLLADDSPTDAVDATVDSPFTHIFRGRGVTFTAPQKRGHPLVCGLAIRMSASGHPLILMTDGYNQSIIGPSVTNAAPDIATAVVQQLGIDPTGAIWIEVNPPEIPYRVVGLRWQRGVAHNADGLRSYYDDDVLREARAFADELLTGNVPGFVGYAIRHYSEQANTSEDAVAQAMGMVIDERRWTHMKLTVAPTRKSPEYVVNLARIAAHNRLELIILDAVLTAGERKEFSFPPEEAVPAHYALYTTGKIQRGWSKDAERIYIGLKFKPFENVILVEQGGKVLPLLPTPLRSRGEGGVSWGFPGQGSDTTAQAILAYEYDPKTAEERYRHFSHTVVQGFLSSDTVLGEQWRCTSQQIKEGLLSNAR